MKDFFQHLSFRKLAFSTILLLFVALSLLILNLSPSLQATYNKVDLGVIASVESNTFNRQAINELIIALRREDVVATKKILEMHPDFLESTSEEISLISSVDEATNDGDIIHKVGLLELVLELRLSGQLIQQLIASQNTNNLQKLINNDITKPFNAWLRHSSDAESLSIAQERLLSSVVKLKASDSSRSTHFSTKYYVKRYKQERAKKSKHGLFSKGLLHASWLKQSRAVKNRGASKNKRREEFYLVSNDLNSDVDLIRLLNHENETVVKIAAELISFYLPKNAINALRFQLLRSKKPTIKIALLDALSAYGTEARSATKQLKSLLVVTKSDDVRFKINEAISKLNGKFPQNNKA